MEDQDKPVEEQANGAASEENGASAEPTKVGQVMHDLARVTRPLPTAPPA